MGIFGFGKKKQPISSSNAPPLPGDSQESPELPPLPPLPDTSPGLPGSLEYDEFDKSLEQPPLPPPGSSADSIPLPPSDDVDSPNSGVDWSAPIEHPDLVSGDVPSRPEQSESPPVPPQEETSTLNLLPPMPEQDVPAGNGKGESATQAHDDQETLINIELPAFEGEDVKDLPSVAEQSAQNAKASAPASPAKRMALPQAPVRATVKPAPVADRQMQFDDMEPPSMPFQHHIKHEVDIFVDLAEYANIVKNLQQLKRSLNSRITSISRMPQKQEEEQVQLHEFHMLLEHSQRLIMKIDRIIFD